MSPRITPHEVNDGDLPVVTGTDRGFAHAPGGETAEVLLTLAG
ncbi:hypothetical protein ACFYRC_26935 [Streptomyces sp. NPDC005279]